MSADRPRSAVPPAAQSLSPLGRVAVLLAAAVAVLAVALAAEGVGAGWVGERQARAALARVEAWLDEVDGELAALEVAHGDEDGCGDAAREVLLRASLRSTAAQAFVRFGRDRVACGPSATRAFVDAVDGLPAAAVSGRDGRSTLQAAATLAGGAVVVRPLAEGAALAALLESRRLRDALGPYDRSGPVIALLMRGERTVLLAARGPTDAGADRSGRFAGTVARLESARWPIVVTAAVDRGVVGARLREAAPVWLLLFVALGVAATAALQQWIRRRDRPEARLRRALRKRQFEPVVQPIVDARSGRCVGAEVLLRRAHPIRGLVGPIEFIALAEATGLIVPISDLLVAKARDQLGPIARRHPGLYFSFNVAPAQLQDPGLGARLLAAFDAASLPPSRVLLEITERDAIDDDAMRCARALREAGFRLAIDDFGTGHSSLAALERLRVDRIKFDREFVRRIDEPGSGTVVLDTMVALAQRLGTPVIAEGVETEAQWRWLAERGVEYLQGYLFGRPMTVAEFERWLAHDAAEDTAPLAPAEPRAASTARFGAFVPARIDGGTGVAEIDLDRLVAEMQGSTGLDVRDRTWRLRTFPRCFVGTEAVDWLAARLSLPREQAVRLGRRMAAVGRIEHVAQEHDFDDAPLYYRFTEVPQHESGATGVFTTDLRELAREMRGPSGLRLRAQDWRGVRYRDAFTGARATRWLQQRLRVDRDEAEAIGRALLRTGAIRHVVDERPYRSNREPLRFG